MATITSSVSPFSVGFSTSQFFIPGTPAAQAYPHQFSGGGTSVQLTYTTLGLRLTYTGNNLVFSGDVPVSGAVKTITVAQFDSVSQGFRPIGVLTLPIKEVWAFANVFTASFANAYAAGGHHITGTQRMDTLVGGNLGDVIIPVGHNDLVQANGGNDVLVLSSNGPADVLPASATLSAAMGAGVDTLRYDNVGGSLNLRGAGLSSFEKITLNGSGALHLDAADLGTAFLTNTQVTSAGGILKFWQAAAQPFSAASLIVTGNLIVSVAGTAGNDVQLGNASSRDYLLGLNGNDWLRGLAGTDTLLGGDGNDTLDGGAGADLFYGGSGDDVYITASLDVIVEEVGGGTDTIRAYASHAMDANVENLMVYANGGVRIDGNSLSNQIGGGAGADSLLGASGNDTIAASEGNDVVSGGAGNDILNAGEGNDVVRGEAGNDRLVGNRGADVMIGGEGADVFVYRTADGLDRIADFSTNGGVADVIDLAELTSVTGWGDLVANHMVQVGLNVEIRGGGGDTLVLERVWLPLLNASDFVF
jgi:Ca2+-binding RTX toxin-like protein